MIFTCKYFNALSLDELYDILQLRSNVFVTEQKCVYLDLDTKDKTAYHLFCKVHETIRAYCRILAPGAAFSEASIGRVVTHPHFRNQGLGFALMQAAISKTKEIYGVETIRIGAQCYLQSFYEALGFACASDAYIEDGISHIQMLHQTEK